MNIYGGGIINGNGQVWWDRMATNSSVQRPILFGVMGLKGGQISGINLVDPPNWFHFVANSSDLIFDGIYMHAISNDSNAAKNSGKLKLHSRFVCGLANVCVFVWWTRWMGFVSL